MTPRVAIVCSGLGYVSRGNETWAATVAEGIHKSGGNVILFGSGPRVEARSPYVRVPCLRRDGWIRRFVSWDKAYLWEQITFARNLRRYLRADRFDIVHTADPNLAQQLIAHCRREKIELIYQDSLFIGPEWCAKFPHVHVLAPAYKEWASGKAETTNWRVIPQTVDTKIFSPSKRGAQKTILAVGDFSTRGNKRMDWIIDECAAAKSSQRLLLVGNASETDRVAVESRANEKLRGRFEIKTGISYTQMPGIYQSADLFVHAATREPFGLVLIEAMASGLPVLGHSFEVTKWIVGEGGIILDMTRVGELAREIDRFFQNETLRTELAAKAVARARAVFDKNVILPMYHAWYNELAQGQFRA
jgi:glycosyltransferase involved in cell wall biosynthesis